jgi:hypothetical protein
MREDVTQTWGLLCEHIINHLDNWLPIIYFGHSIANETPIVHHTLYNRFLHR